MCCHEQWVHAAGWIDRCSSWNLVLPMLILPQRKCSVRVRAFGSSNSKRLLRASSDCSVTSIMGACAFGCKLLPTHRQHNLPQHTKAAILPTEVHIRCHLKHCCSKTVLQQVLKTDHVVVITALVYHQPCLGVCFIVHSSSFLLCTKLPLYLAMCSVYFYSSFYGIQA